jgi:hypothetical protein
LWLLVEAVVGLEQAAGVALAAIALVQVFL